MFYYKKIKDGEIIEFGTHSLIVPTEAIEITEEEYKLLAAELEEYQAKVGEYVQQVTSGEITLDDVPEDYRAEVKAKLPNNDYGIDNTTYNNIIDDYTMELVEKGVI